MYVKTKCEIERENCRGTIRSNVLKSTSVLYD